MADVSIFADESGEQGFQSKYYALTLVFHDSPILLSPCSMVMSKRSAMQACQTFPCMPHRC